MVHHNIGSLYSSHLPPASGRSFQLEVRGKVCSLSSLLEELYQKSGTLHLWSLVRHMAGVLEKSVEDLGTVCLFLNLPLSFSHSPSFSLSLRLPLIFWCVRKTFQSVSQTTRSTSHS